MLVKEKRIEKINEAELNDGKFVAYWMQSSQRLEYNQALGYAVERANQLNQPLLIFFLINSNYPEAEYGHFKFMFEGLKELKKKLKNNEFNFYIFDYQKKDIFNTIFDQASLLVSEKPYLNYLKKWKQKAAAEIDIPFYFVESNIICPIEEVSEKEEYAAYTIRKKIDKIKDEYLEEYNLEELQNRENLTMENEYIIDDLAKFLSDMQFEEKIDYAKYFKGGYKAAKEKLNDFISNKLKEYDEKRNIPYLDFQSDLSPYLQFGQISAQEAAVKALNSQFDSEAFLEELIVRRELSYNFVYYNQNYENGLQKILPDWAYQTLAEHGSDQREYTYSYSELENGESHDQYWNAAQKEMRITGKMHNYMRMYWGKKILEWVSDPETAYQWALKLNNKYSLDGRNPNSYAGVAWCFGKHDRAWKERKIFGKVRYMNANGLERKFDMEKYQKKIAELESDNF